MEDLDLSTASVSTKLFLYFLIFQLSFTYKFIFIDKVQL